MPTTGYPHTHCFIEGALIFNDDHICLTPRWLVPYTITLWQIPFQGNNPTYFDSLIHQLIFRDFGIGRRALELVGTPLRLSSKTPNGEDRTLVFQVYTFKGTPNQTLNNLTYWATKDECLRKFASGQTWLLDVIKAGFTQWEMTRPRR